MESRGGKKRKKEMIKRWRQGSGNKETREEMRERGREGGERAREGGGKERHS